MLKDSLLTTHLEPLSQCLIRFSHSHHTTPLIMAEAMDVDTPPQVPDTTVVKKGGKNDQRFTVKKVCFEILPCAVKTLAVQQTRMLIVSWICDHLQVPSRCFMVVGYVFTYLSLPPGRKKNTDSSFHYISTNRHRG